MDLHIEDGRVAPRITTPRLVLRGFRMDDAPAITAALSDPRVADWLTMVPQPYRLQDATDFIRDFTQDPALPHWAITRDGQLIGTISCKPDLGYWLAQDAHGHGYMTEAATAAVTYHFLTTNADLLSGYHLGNDASANVLAKLGFQNTHQEQVTTQQGIEVTLQRMVLSYADWAARA